MEKITPDNAHPLPLPIWHMSNSLRSSSDTLNRMIQISYICKNIERHTADTIVSWPNPKQWVMVHTSDLMMIITQSIYILSIVTRVMGKLKTYSPTYCIMDNGENMLNLTHTLDKIYLDMHFISAMSSDKFAQWWQVQFIDALHQN